MKTYEIIPSILQRSVWVPLRLIFYFFCSFEIIGQENLKNSKSNVLIAGNHSSELDPIIMVASLPFFSRYLPIFFVSREKNYYEDMGWKKIIYGGTLFKMWGANKAYVNLKNYKQSLRDHLELMRNGKSILIFPSGKRNVHGEPPKAKGGVSFLANETSLPIVPVLIEGAECMTLHDFLFRKRKIKIIFGKPLYSKDILMNVESPIINAEYNDYEIASSIILEKIKLLSNS